LEAIRASRSGAVTAGRFRTRRGAPERCGCVQRVLQELRVAQTGVQLLTGFWLILPFQQRFIQLDGTMRTVYLITVAYSLGSTVLLVAPGVCTGLLFGRHRLKSLVSASHNYAIAGLLLLGVALAGVVLVIFDTVPDRSRRGSRTSAHCWRWPASGSSCRCGSAGVRTPLSRVC